jgi:6-phosphogluconolactonase
MDITMSNGLRYAYVGCRTTRERNARGDGITVYAVHLDGEWKQLQLVEGLFNPSYLAFDRTVGCLHSAR